MFTLLDQALGGESTGDEMLGELQTGDINGIGIRVLGVIGFVQDLGMFSYISNGVWQPLLGHCT